MSVVASGLLTTDAQTSLQALDAGKAATSHTHTASAISDSTIPGRAILTAASAAAQVALLGLTNPFTTGDVKLTFKTVADSGWLMMNDGTIGDGFSGATFADPTAQALFTLLWTNVNDAWASVSTGRGVSAAADWAAHKTIALTKALGRALAIGGSGSGEATARALGQNLGEENHALLTAEVPPLSFSGTTGGQSADHTHSIAHGAATALFAGSSVAAADSSSGNTGGTSNDHTHGFSGTTDGGGGLHNNMQPTSFLNAMIKL